MINKKIIHLIYFSPTGTTKSVLEGIAEGFDGYEVVHHDLTLSEKKPVINITEGVAVFGLPVYAGRAQVTALERMMYIRGSAPAVVAVVYGNRDFEDALVELRDFASDVGFVPIAGGAFIGEHSYATEEHPVALGRPDEKDANIAKGFGKAVYDKVISNDTTMPEMDGNVPYKDLMLPKGVIPATSEDCELCGACLDVCPVGALKITDTLITDADKCIMCMACAKICSKNARYIDNPMTLERIGMLVKNCSGRKEPSLYV